MNLQELRELSHRVDDPRELALYVLKTIHKVKISMLKWISFTV